MKERPINMRAEEVRAILARRKTQFRRVMRTQPDFVAGYGNPGQKRTPYSGGSVNPAIIPCPFGQPGDRLWARECWGVSADTNPKTGLADILFRADQAAKQACRWRPSIHMPRWACRIILEVVSVRVERLQDISRADAKAEGLWPSPHNGLEMVNGVPYGNAQLAFRALWRSINGPEDWEANPWVWVVEFRRLEGAQ